jgi:hypothetical protein
VSKVWVMSWRAFKRIVAGFAAVLSAGASLGFTSPVLADEAYLCGPDKVVYVAVADLEMKKRTDPCIAAYYGLKVEAPQQPQPVAAVAPVKSAAKSPAKVARAELKPLSDAEVPDRVTNKLERQASLEAPRAMPGTDYRNVKILNAASPEDAWFRHTK